MDSLAKNWFTEILSFQVPKALKNDTFKVFGSCSSAQNL